MIEVLLFLLGLLTTAVGAVKFSKAGVQLAALLKVKRVLIGATVVSLATTTPETVVAVLASFQNHTDLALGNALGSPVANLGLILGLVLLFGKFTFESNIFKATLILVGLSVFTYLVVFIQNTINAIGGILLTFAGFAYLLFLVKTIEDERSEKENNQIGIFALSIRVTKAFFSLVLGLGLIITGGYFLILGAVKLAKILSVSEIFIGLTLIAVGTSLPELAISVVSIFKKTVSISVGNLIGASVITLTLTLGIAALISPVKTSPSVFFLDFPAVIVLSLGFAAGQYFKINHKILGAVFLVFYLFYLIVAKIAG